MKNYFNYKVNKEGSKQKGLFEISNMISQRERAGEKVIHMEIGRPDFDTPKAVKDRAIEALDKGEVHYTEFNGIDELREAISERERLKTGLKYDPINEIVVTTGASEGLYCIWNVFLNSDDEVMIPSPYYSAYISQLRYSGANLVTVPVLKDGKIKYDIEDFKARLTNNTKMILINSPHNPSGYVMTEEDLNTIAEFAIENDLIVVSDECYDNFIFEGDFRSIATLPGMRERTIIVNSSSKTFSMTGWRIGYVMGNKTFITEIGKIHSQISLCATSFAQSGAIEAYKNVYKEVEDMAKEFKLRRDYVANYLREIDSINFIEPKGAFYVFINVGELGMSGYEFSERILKEKGIALAPGNAYGNEWKDYVRLAYTCSMSDIIEGMDLMKSFITEVKSEV